jgi:hypothetical protein
MQGADGEGKRSCFMISLPILAPLFGLVSAQYIKNIL